MQKLEKLSSMVGKYMSVIVLIVAVVSLLVPSSFKWAAPHVSMLLGVVMFGMGMTLKLEDFKIVFSRPKDVIFGCLAQFTIMPLLAFALATLFQLPPELAVGVILVGTCPGGTSSNVMTYLAKGDVALSVGMTMVSTVLAPILTPIMTLMLAGKWIPVSATSMFISIFKVVIVPIVLGIIVHKVAEQVVEKLVKVLPLVSVISIVLIVGGVVGSNAQKILTTGLVVFAVVILHNMCGYGLGYFLGKGLKMDEAKRRAIAIEVGMQNSGLAVTLATAHFNPVAAIPGAIFSVWHNISGSLVANFLANQSKPTGEIDQKIEQI
ncbi:MAG: bile acid:sodium symporter family protein [Cellulosilyticaceae bacterium]